MSIKFGSIDKIQPSITSDMFNNKGKHNSFSLVLNTDNRYPNKKDPIILRFDANLNRWVYVADKKIINFGHLIETTDIENDYLALSKIPLDGVIWDIFIYEDKKIFKVLKESDLKVRNNIVTGLEEYIGKEISLRYCFGEYNNDVIPVKIDNKVETSYITDVDDFVVEPRSDINDIDGPSLYNGEITKDYNLPNPKKHYNMQQMANQLNIFSDVIKALESRKVITTERLLIYENKAVLPSEAFGDIINGYAVIFEGIGKEYNTIFEATCSTNGTHVLFDSEDNLNGKYCTVSYLTVGSKE